MRWLADFIYVFAGLCYLPVLALQMIFQNKNRRGWWERFGFVKPFAEDRRRIWIHAVSLGEVNATPGLVKMLRERWPNVDVVVSTTTDTGYARAVKLYGKQQVFHYPLDFGLVVASVLHRVRPSLIVLVELEVWYNLVRMASRRGIPVAVVNGRLTKRSASRFSILGPVVRPMFRDLACVCAQDEPIAGRFARLGVPESRIEVTSSLKWDTAVVADEVDGAAALASAMGITPKRTLWVCGSTGPGEEEIILRAYQRFSSAWANPARGVQENPVKTEQRQPPILAIVPRKPERFDEVAKLITSFGFVCLRRSRCEDGSATTLPGNAVILGDSMGELRKFYSLATIVFIGRSLVPMGGSDPMEVAALGKPILVGPHTENFAAPIQALMAASALKVVTGPDDLVEALTEAVGDKEELVQEMGCRAREVVLANRGATVRTVDALARIWTDSDGLGEAQGDKALSDL